MTVPMQDIDRALLPGSYVGVPQDARPSRDNAPTAREQLMQPLIDAGYEAKLFADERSVAVLASWVAKGVAPADVAACTADLLKRDVEQGLRFRIRRIKTQRPVIALELRVLAAAESRR